MYAIYFELQVNGRKQHARRTEYPVYLYLVDEPEGKRFGPLEYLDETEAPTLPPECRL